MIEKLKQLIDPHIESFDYFLEEGIKEAGFFKINK